MLAWISAFAEMTFVFASPARRLLSWAEERGSCPMPTPATLLDKIWSAHAIETHPLPPAPPPPPARGGGAGDLPPAAPCDPPPQDLVGACDGDARRRRGLAVDR